MRTSPSVAARCGCGSIRAEDWSAPTSGSRRTASRPAPAGVPRSPGVLERPHRFKVLEGAGIELHYDFGRMKPPEEVHLDVKGLRNKTKRLEAYWNGSVFAGPDIPAPGATP